MMLCRTEGVPHKGWSLEQVIDLHEDEGLSYGEYEDCQFCDHEQIRFVHLLNHPDYSQAIRVGCMCACRLTNDYVEPKRQERILRNKAARRSRFPARKGWSSTCYGGKTIKLNGHRVTVASKSGRFRLWIDGKEGGRFYAQEKEAMLRGFDYVQTLTPSAAR